MFLELHKSIQTANPDKTKQVCQREATIFWNAHKFDPEFNTVLQRKLEELNIIAKKKRAGLLSFWTKVSFF